ncbi:MAG: hypothetical protein IPI00_11420 [Flavobacteriales bacterium]|nr:hypothetical protein [Flavobacteriales bacterium]
MVSVTVVNTPNAGLPGNATLCTSDAAIALFDQLIGSPDVGGTWTGPSVVVGGMSDPATMTDGVYTYTSMPPPCQRKCNSYYYGSCATRCRHGWFNDGLH